jgi:type IV pilus assembly protein PilC
MADDTAKKERTPRSEKRPIKLPEVMEFSRQMASFLEAGIPIMDALETVSMQVGTPSMAAVVNDLLDQVRRGGSFTDAVNSHPKVFPAYYRAIVRSADFTGRLDIVLNQLTSYLERDLNARRQIKSALTYPILVLCVAGIALVAMTMFVLPKFAGLYRTLGARLPVPTRMLLWFTDFMQTYWWAVLLVCFVLFLVFNFTMGGEKGKPKRDRMYLKLPVIGSLTRIIAVERFSRVLAALANAGVPLPDGIEVAGAATQNAVFMEAIDEVRETLVRGGGLSTPMEECGAFPLPALQMVRVGERTGQLAQQLTKTAAYYEREVTFRLKKATDLFQPVVIFGVGIIVGFVAVAQVAAMYSVFSQVK